MVVKKHNSFKRSLEKNVDKLMEPEKLYDLIKKISTQIREKRKTNKQVFNGSLGSPDGVYSELTILIYFIDSGSNDNLELKFPLPVETISQLIVYNHVIKTHKGPSEVPDTNGAMHTKGYLPSFMLA